MKTNIPYRAALAADVLPSPRTASLRASIPIGGAGVEVDEAAGVIRGAAVMKVGPAEGHGFSLDAESIRQVEALGRAQAGGVKVRFKHPRSSEDGSAPDDLGDVIGFVDNLRIDGDAVRGDVHLEDYAEVLPGLGDVRTYLLRRAKSRPESLGLSCVIGFELEQVTDGRGNVIGQVARIGGLDAIDVVGRGAATPNGLLAAANTNPSNQPPAGAVPVVAAKQEPKRVHLNSGVSNMNEKIKSCLMAHFGLAADATDEAAQALYDENKAAVDAKVATLAAVPAPASPSVAQLAAQTHEAMLAAEGKRVVMLTQLGEALRLDPNDPADKAVVSLAIASGDDVPAARTRYLKRLQDKCKPVEGLAGGHISVGENRNLASLRTALPQAMLMKMGRQRLYAFGSDGRVVRDADGRPVADKFDPRAGELASLRVRDIFREYLGALGVDQREVARLSDDALAKAFTFNGLRRAFPQVAQLAQGFDDFDSILANVQNKGLRMAYVEMAATWQMWCGRRTTPDFKTITDTQLSDVPDLQTKDEHGRYRRVQVSDSKETWRLGEYGHIVAFTRRALLGDDLNAFASIPMKEASAARRLEETLAYRVLTDNAAMADTVTLFHATHANLDSATGNVGAPSVTTLGLGRKAMRLQTAPKGAILNLIPKFLIVPAALENVAEQYTSASYVAAVQTSINPFAGTGRTPLVPIVQPRLDASSATKWYLAADPNQIDTVKLAFLESEPEPVLEQNEDFHSDDVEYKVRHACAAAALDHRGVYANNGA